MTNPSRTIKPHGRTIGASFPYSPDVVAAMKMVGEGQWLKDEKIWKFPRKRVHHLLDTARKYNFTIDPRVLEIAQKVERPLDVELVEGGVSYYAPNKEDAPKLKNVTLPSVAGLNLAPITQAGAIVEWAESRGYSVDSRLYERMRWRAQNNFSNFHYSDATSAPPTPITGLVTKPLETQWVPARHALSNPRFLLADEQGLGKTLESLMVARLSEQESKRTIVICPSSLTRTWASEAQAHFEPGTFTPHIVEGEEPTPIPDDANLIIVGWAILSFWTQKLLDSGYDMVIADEGHYGKSGRTKYRKVNGEKVKIGGSERSGAFIDIIHSLPEYGKAVILTGTPTPNRPDELLATLQALGVGKMFGSELEFKIRYMNGRQRHVGNGRYAWTFSGGSNLGELATLLRSSGLYIRRTKQHLVELGLLPNKYVDGALFYSSKQGSPYVVEGDPQVRAEYEAELQSFLHKTGKYRVVGKGGDGGHLKALSQLNRLSGRMIFNDVVGIARDLIERGEKVVIVAHHRDIVNRYAQELNAVKIQGGMSTKSVEEGKAKFNAEGMDTPAMVIALAAGKTGHTLCLQPDKKCAHIIFAEQGWVPGDERQAQDRIWRIGQNRDVKVLNVVARGSVGEMVYYSRQKKARIIDSLIDGADDETTAPVATFKRFLSEYRFNVAPPVVK